MNAQSLIKLSSLACLLAALPVSAAIPLTGPCDPDFGSCQHTPKETRAQGTRASKPAAPVTTAPAQPAPAKAAPAKSAPEPRADPPSGGEDASRNPSTELPEHSISLVPAALRAP